jgi:hypothetical protein
MIPSRRTATRWRRGALLAAFALAAPRARAQTNSAALDLLFPIGARATALGAAFTMERGTEAIWYNPAGLARMTRAEFGIDHFTSFQLESADALSLAFPVKAVGTFGLAARLFNYGTAPATDSGTGQEVGISSYRSYVIGGSFAASFGKRLDAGISFRVYQLSSPCSGICTRVVSVASSTATVDAGVQYHAGRDSALDIALVLSNIGPNLQVHDKPQADGLPARVHLGAGYRLNLLNVDPNLRGRIMAEAIATPAFSSGELHLGAEAGYVVGETSVFARGGYVVQQSQDAASPVGPSLGIGLATKRVQIDFARIFESFSTGLGKPPTYISIRLGL